MPRTLLALLAALAITTPAGAQSPFAQGDDPCRTAITIDSGWTADVFTGGVEVVATDAAFTLTAVEGITTLGDWRLSIIGSVTEPLFTIKAGAITNPAGEESPAAVWQSIPVAVFHGQDELFRLSANEQGIYATEASEFGRLKTAAELAALEAPDTPFYADFLRPDGKGALLRIEIAAPTLADGFSAWAAHTGEFACAPE
ncbi:hypothetical protein [Aquisalinus flavus]|uniref:Uncharacterized protein n=1 Tax=Aquisalinus flavus TaxID=1526572 RepID=A0A8J2V7S2_9PROT|nr:hypothetical protein [Aquisalinus flavus]MBD0425554.1 hypothetical protein [Aquisalinus flavus]UNE48820.1 hypothetical protein FF099_12555 [Aquisalinus flavus]GGD15167.1 hypothetical protein GCM10011342_24890 [Aquisalinus flavus]